MIEIKKVSKRFDKIEAVSDVSLSIEEGQVFGLLGTNGAGGQQALRHPALLPAHQVFGDHAQYAAGAGALLLMAAAGHMLNLKMENSL